MATTYNFTNNGSTTIGYSGRFENTLAIYGTFEGSTVSVFASYDNNIFIPLPDISGENISTGTAAIYTFKLVGPAYLRFTVADGSAPIDLKITLG